MGAIHGACHYLLTLDSDCFGKYCGMTLDGVVVMKPDKFLGLRGINRS